MSYKEERFGCYCHSDVNIIAALVNKSGILKGKKVDLLHTLPELDLAFPYVKVVELEEKMPEELEDRHRPPVQGHFIRTVGGVPDADAPHTVFRPVVMFAVKPYRGSLVLARKKVRMWHNGKLWMPPHYAVDHRLLMMMVPSVLGAYWKKLRRGGEPRMKKHGGTYIIVDEVAASDMEAIGDGNVLSESERPASR